MLFLTFKSTQIRIYILVVFCEIIVVWHNMAVPPSKNNIDISQEILLFISTVYQTVAEEQESS